MGIDLLVAVVVAIWIIALVAFAFDAIPLEGLAFILQFALAACLVQMVFF